MSTNGVVNGAGFNNTPIASALSSARSGTVFAFSPGTHRPLHLSNVDGITITAAVESDPPTFSSGSYSSQAGIEISSSSNVSISHAKVRHSLWGVRVENSNAVTIAFVDVSDVGQEGIRVTEKSRDVTIKDSRVSDTGNRSGVAPDGQPYATFGEGIYLGTGRGDADDVSNVRILRNHISGTRTEAIDVKVPVSDVEIRNNTITDIHTDTSGAIVVHVESGFSAADANIVISGNQISNVTTGSNYRDGVAIVLGSSAVVSGNTITGMQHFGVRIEDSGPQGGNIVATIEDNSFESIGIEPVWQASNQATVRLSGNSGL